MRPTSLRTSDRTSLLRFMGLRMSFSFPPIGVKSANAPPHQMPCTALRIFSHDAFFQPYMPLQQMDTLAAKSWLVGTTNQIVTQQKECRYDLLVNVRRSSPTSPMSLSRGSGEIREVPKLKELTGAFGRLD